VYIIRYTNRDNTPRLIFIVATEKQSEFYRINVSIANDFALNANCWRIR